MVIDAPVSSDVMMPTFAPGVDALLGLRELLLPPEFNAFTTVAGTFAFLNALMNAWSSNRSQRDDETVSGKSMHTLPVELCAANGPLATTATATAAALLLRGASLTYVELSSPDSRW